MRKPTEIMVPVCAKTSLRLVPQDPSAEEFPPRPFACDLRPTLCEACTAVCPVVGMNKYEIEIPENPWFVPPEAS